MEAVMNDLRPLLPQQYPLYANIYEIPRNLLELEVSVAKVTADLDSFRVFLQISDELDNLGKKASKSTKNKLLSCKFHLTKLISLTNELQEALLSKPAPSEYAKASVWQDMQTRPKPILCLRPTAKQGLPLTLLHSIFSQFRQLSRQPLPNSPTGAKALIAALRLCSCMGDAFDSEEARSKAFDDAVGGFLQGAGASRRIQGDGVNGEADRVYCVGGRCVMLREDKIEIGNSGDAHMQVARLYDLACEQMETNKVIPNTPVFLLCVMGPTLTIAGGFKDGDDTVVEPLCPVLFMLKDMDDETGRAVQLATHLYALHACMEQLPNLLNPPSPTPGVPRVFPSFQDTDGKKRILTFQRRLEIICSYLKPWMTYPKSFALRSSTVHTAKRCIKCSAARVAPKLLSVSRIEGGPAMIVMEMLDKPWQTLYTFAQRNPRWTADGVQSTIHERLEMILTKLKEGGVVHGDIRPNNIMVKPGDEGSAVLIDFDWAGEDGKVHYPLSRNHSATRWRGEPGSAISLDHDRWMLDTQWNLLLAGQF